MSGYSDLVYFHPFCSIIKRTIQCLVQKVETDQTSRPPHFGLGLHYVLMSNSWVKYRFEANEYSENCTGIQLFVGDRATCTSTCTLERQWLQHIWNNENIFENRVVRANEC